MSQAFRWTRRVEFCETDAAGIAHFSAFLCYMEQAEHALLRAVGWSVTHDLGDGWHLSWPRVHVECDYAGVARFEDELDIEVRVAKLGNKSVTYHFSFELKGNRIASGKIVAVCCRVASGKPLASVAIPMELLTRLQEYVEETPA
ncbi:MAG: acyl-CoA thioesterase [Planctomycetales bacterium]|nr:acyl-CoA thioesterase [Planctomycetales bacterium]